METLKWGRVRSISPALCVQRQSRSSNRPTDQILGRQIIFVTLNGLHLFNKKEKKKCAKIVNTKTEEWMNVNSVEKIIHVNQ